MQVSSSPASLVASLCSLPRAARACWSQTFASVDLSQRLASQSTACSSGRCHAVPDAISKATSFFTAADRLDGLGWRAAKQGTWLSIIVRDYGVSVPRYKARSPAATAVAAGLVDANSRILTHFKKNIERPHLTHRIMKRRDVDEVRDMVRLYDARMDPVHVSAVLARLQALLRGNPTEQQLETSREAVRLLVPVIESACARKEGAKFRHQFKPDAAAACMWGVAKLPVAVRAEIPESTLDALLGRAVRSSEALHDSPPRTMSLLLWSISRLLAGGAPGGTSATGLSSTAASTAVASILAMTLSDARVRPYLRMSSPAVLAQFCVSLSALGCLTPSLAAKMSDEVTARLPNLAFKPFEAADFVGVVQGIVRAGHADVTVPLLAAVAAHLSLGSRAAAEMREASWKPEHLSQLSAAFAAAGVKHDGMFQSISAAAQPKLGRFHGWALEQLKAAYESLGYQESWLKEAQVAVLPGIKAVQPMAAGGIGT